MGRTLELSETRVFLFDAEGRERTIRDAYAAMLASAWKSMVTLCGVLAEAGVVIDPLRHGREDGLATVAAISEGVELIQPALAGFANVDAQTAWRLAFILAYKARAHQGTSPTCGT